MVDCGAIAAYDDLEDISDWGDELDPTSAAVDQLAPDATTLAKSWSRKTAPSASLFMSLAVWVRRGSCSLAGATDSEPSLANPMVVGLARH